MARSSYFLSASALVFAAWSAVVAPVRAAGDEPVTSTTVAWRIEGDPSQCIGFLPKPDCGYEPLDAGERGGSLQITLFLVMMGGLGVIGTVVVRNVVRRDRAIARAGTEHKA
ncbi:MAG: hypothetical protein RLZZ305_605 [Actinomycetota bacterium]